jgi:hypothetical protein
MKNECGSFLAMFSTSVQVQHGENSMNLSTMLEEKYSTVHDIIHIHDNVMWDWQYSVKYYLHWV